MEIDQSIWRFDNKSTLLIVGNGFDLNLGLKTSYANFIESEQFAKICNSNNFAKYLKNQNSIQRWVDIENEIPQYLGPCAKVRGRVPPCLPKYHAATVQVKR